MTIHRDDIEAKLREIEGVVTDTEEELSRRRTLILVGIGVVAVGFIAYRIWKRSQRPVRIEVFHQG